MCVVKALIEEEEEGAGEVEEPQLYAAIANATANILTAIQVGVGKLQTGPQSLRPTLAYSQRTSYCHTLLT